MSTSSTHKRYRRQVRQSMRAVPSGLQWILTWLTGKPLHAEERVPRLPTWLDVLLAPALALGAMAAMLWLVRDANLLHALAIGCLWFVVVGALRKIQVTHLHHAIHNRLFRRAALNRAYAAVVPSLILVQNGTEYRTEHLAHHNLHNFTTHGDADAAFLAKLGFLPGRSRDELWINLWMTLCSPVFHLLFALGRLGSALLRSGRAGLACGCVTVGAGAAIGLWLGWKALVVAVLIPMFPLYHVSALLQFLTEHAWNVTGASVSGWDDYAQRCWGRFCGAPYPVRTGSGLRYCIGHVAAVGGWIASMLVMHLPVRVACLVADLPVHDWHHLAHLAGQDSREWMAGIRLREKAIAAGDKPQFAARELWGLFDMIEHQFGWLESLARGPRVSSAGPQQMAGGEVAGDRRGATT